MADTPDIISIISTYIYLEKQGDIYKGFCPFCNSVDEKLVVRPKLNEWHCFECGAGGNADDFVELYEKTILLHSAGDERVHTRNGSTMSDAEERASTDEQSESGPLADSATALADYYSRLREVPGYKTAAIFDGNMKIISRDNTGDDDESNLDQLHQLFIGIIDDAHAVFGEDLTAMECEVILSSDHGMIIYSATHFREEPVHVIALGSDPRQQFLMRMKMEQLKKY